MAFTPFDFNEAIAQRREHAREGLRYGSPVVGFSRDEGLVLLTVRRTQRKVYEIYDRLMYSAIGNQSDIEAVRLGAVDLAAREGFERSPDDVTAQRLVGFSLSPALKDVFRDQWRAPSIIRAVFAELGPRPGDDTFFILNYDGEFAQHGSCVALAGTPDAEERMRADLAAISDAGTLEAALTIALRAWAAGVVSLNASQHDDEPGRAQAHVTDTLRDELSTGRIEAGMLDRRVRREARFVMLPEHDLATVAAVALGAERD